jgi:hypothetical protein
MPVGGFIFGKFVLVQGRKNISTEGTPTPPPDHPYWDQRTSPLTRGEKISLGIQNEQQKEEAP